MKKKTMEKINRSDAAFRRALVKLATKKKCGVEKITLKELCEAAGYTPMAFYYKYENKERLAKQIVEDELRSTKKWSSEQLKAYATNDTRTICSAYFEHIYQNKELYYCLMNNLFMPDTMEYFARSMRKWYKDNYHNPDNYRVNEEYYDMFLYLDYSKGLNSIKYWANRGFDIAPSEFADMYLKYFDGYRPVIFPELKIIK